MLLLAVASLGETIFSRGSRAGARSRGESRAAGKVLTLAADGILAPLIERTYALGDIAEAHARVDSGHKTGNLVILPHS